MRRSRTEGPGLAAWARALRRSALQDMLVATARPGVISLALGLPAADLFPTGAIGGAIERLLTADPRALQYGPSSQELRSFIAKVMGRRGVTCDPEQVFLTAGAQQGMSMLARLLLDTGATVMLEDHCYPGFQQAIAPLEPRIVTVPTHLDGGVDIDAVERALMGDARAVEADPHDATGRGRRAPGVDEGAVRPQLLYAMSDGHNPSGASLPLEARRRLAGLARSHGMVILEDDAYGMLTYDGEERQALRAFEAEWVFYLGSFSKTLAPALRTGWIVLPERFVGPLAALKESSDIDTATLGQRVVTDFVASGAFEGHLARLSAEYARRRDALLAAVARSFPAGTRWSRPRSGFFTWVELPGGVDTTRLLEVALERERVAFVPGAAFAAGDAIPARSALRLSFSFSPPDVLEEGIERIARALDALGRPRASEAVP